MRVGSAVLSSSTPDWQYQPGVGSAFITSHSQKLAKQAVEERRLDNEELQRQLEDLRDEYEVANQSEFERIFPTTVGRLQDRYETLLSVAQRAFSDETTSRPTARCSGPLAQGGASVLASLRRQYSVGVVPSNTRGV